jgi:hypothetical protein
MKTLMNFIKLIIARTGVAERGKAHRGKALPGGHRPLIGKEAA